LSLEDIPLQLSGVTRMHGKQKIKTLIAAQSFLFLAACTTAIGPEMTMLPARIDYVCASGRVLSVARTPDQRTAAVLVDGKEIRLVRADSAAQEKYTDGRYTLYLEDQITVIYGACTSPVPLPTYYR
jgi:membrane-bound inhibitor of C-type lysozyme